MRTGHDDFDFTHLSAGLRSPDHTTAAQAFEALFHRNADHLVSFAYGYTHSIDTARDVVHDVFVRLWEQRSTTPTHDLRPYLFKSVRNRALDVRKHERIVAEWEANVVLEYGGAEPSEHNSAESNLAAAELAERIRNAMQRLPPRAQEIVRLNREEGLSPGEIAAVLELAPATVYSQLSRALKQLAEALREPS